MTITDRLYARAEEQPDAVFLYYGERVITFGDMAAMVSVEAAQLADRGVRAGHHVALFCGNRPAFLVAWFALAEIGAVTVPLNTALVGDGLRYSLTQSESTLLVIEPELLDAIRADLDELERHLPLRLIEEAMEFAPPTALARRHHSAGDGDLNAILYTSGTTGLPKGAMIPSGNLLQAGDDMVDSLGLSAADRIMVFLPLFHANPQMYGVASALAVGCSLILLKRFSASEFLPAARRYGATGFTFVGTVLAILDKRLPDPDRNHSLRFGVGGGAAPLVWRALEERFGFTVHELYGMTETGGWVTMNTVEARRFGTVGAARRGVTVRVVDEAGHPVPPGFSGEIVARSEREHLFFSGYWREPEITAEMMRGGWLYTGDGGTMDSDGYVTFGSRLKELIRRAGEMIAPAEIELQLLKHPAVRDCAVVGVPDEILGDEIKAVVVADGAVEAHALRDFLAGRIAAHMLPRYVEFRDAIPKTETQKVKRHELVAAGPRMIDTKALTATETAR
jgi:long-chain acyl-CoA synthetase